MKRYKGFTENIYEEGFKPLSYYCFSCGIKMVKPISEYIEYKNYTDLDRKRLHMTKDTLAPISTHTYYCVRCNLEVKDNIKRAVEKINRRIEKRQIDLKTNT